MYTVAMGGGLPGPASEKPLPPTIGGVNPPKADSEPSHDCGGLTPPASKSLLPLGRVNPGSLRALRAPA